MNAEGRQTTWTPLIVAVAPNGARKTKRDHPRVPITPVEIAQDARACLETGASMLHLHVRDAHGAHSLDADLYRAAIDAVTAEVGDRLVIQVTTEAVGRYSPDQQMACVRAVRPEAVSLAVRELIPDADHEARAAAFLDWCRRERVAIQYILYDVADLERLNDLRARGIVPRRDPFRLYVLGRHAGAKGGDPDDLLPFVTHEGGCNDPWAVCAFGPKETACATVACAMGGHVRVGFENNLHLPDGAVANGNADLVAAAVNGARAVGRPVADAEALRSAMATWT